MDNNLAFVAYLRNIQKIENADKIVTADVVLNDVTVTQVIVSVDTVENTKVVYFDANLCLSDTLVKDYPNLANYLGSKNRIRAIKLKSKISSGLSVEVEKFYKYFKNSKEAEKILVEGYAFDKIDKTEICKKYIPKINVEQSSGKKNKKNIKGKMKSKIIPSQWNFHFETAHLSRNAFKINPDDILSLSIKCHGSSFLVSNCLVNKPNFLEKLISKDFIKHEKIVNFLNNTNNYLKRLNILKQEKEYESIYASRKVIKNGILNDEQHYYKEDIWKIANEQLKDKLHKSETVYGEIVGYTPSGGFIQKHYDYGCEVGKCKLYIYRITFTNIDGIVFEYDWEQLKQRCKELGVDHVPELYYGKAKDLFPELSVSEHWNVNFVEALKKKYLEKECEMCNVSTDPEIKKFLKKTYGFIKVPDEGIVLRVEGLTLHSYKLKSENFILFENGLKDKDDYVDIEDQESVEEGETK